MWDPVISGVIPPKACDNPKKIFCLQAEPACSYCRNCPYTANWHRFMKSYHQNIFYGPDFIWRFRRDSLHQYVVSDGQTCPVPEMLLLLHECAFRWAIRSTLPREIGNSSYVGFLRNQKFCIFRQLRTRSNSFTPHSFRRAGSFVKKELQFLPTPATTNSGLWAATSNPLQPPKYSTAELFNVKWNKSK